MNDKKGKNHKLIEYPSMFLSSTRSKIDLILIEKNIQNEKDIFNILTIINHLCIHSKSEDSDPNYPEFSANLSKNATKWPKMAKNETKWPKVTQI